MLTIMLGFASLLSACALGFVLGRIWEIRQEMLLAAGGQAERPPGPELRVTGYGLRQEQSGKGAIASDMQLWEGKVLLLFSRWTACAKRFLNVLCARLKMPRVLAPHKNIETQDLSP